MPEASNLIDKNGNTITFKDSTARRNYQNALNTISSMETNLTNMESNLANKVDKVTGKDLSTNDYDDTAKTKLDDLVNIKSLGPGLSLDSTGRLSVNTKFINKLPTQNGRIEYNGTVQSPTWNDYDTDELTLSGVTSGTEVGSYVAIFTPKDDYVWGNGTQNPINVTWNISNIIISDLPVQENELKYTGSNQSPTWTGYDIDELTISGDTSGTNVGTYTVSFTPNTNYEWWDGTTSAKTVDWNIGKGEANVTVISDSITLDSDHLTATVTLTNPTGEITSVVSDNLSIATISYDNNTGIITVTTTEKVGSTTITISIEASSNYNAGTKTIAIINDFPAIYGVEWDGNITTLSRTDEATDFVDPAPATNNGGVYSSSPFDNIMPWAGMIKEERTGGTMVKIPKYWYKWTRNGSNIKLQIADSEIEGFHVSPAHADRGDGKGERNYVYVGAYHCATDTYKSETGVLPQIGKTRSEFRSLIHNLGVNIWQYDFAMYWTIAMLYLVEYASWDSQHKIGWGCGNGSIRENNGLCDDMKYHTGTNAVGRTTYGHVRYRYIEGLWDNVMDCCDGIYFSGANIYCIKNPADFSETTGGTLVGTRPTTNGFISSWSLPSESGFEYALYPNALNGSNETYVCDDCVYTSNATSLYIGGGFGRKLNRGLFCFDGRTIVSTSTDFIGSRIMELP